MDIKRVAGFVVIAGAATVSVGVGFAVGWYWGVVAAGVLLVAGGIQSLKESNG